MPMLLSFSSHIPVLDKDLDDAGCHDDESKCRTGRRGPFPLLLSKGRLEVLVVDQGREDVGEGAGRGAAGNVQNDAQVVDKEGDEHGAKDKSRGNCNVVPGRKFSVGHTGRVEALDDDLSTDKGLDRQGREAVESEAESSQDDHDIAIISRKVV